MLRRECSPLYGARLANALARPRPEARVTLWPARWRVTEGVEELEIGWDDLFAVLSEWRPWRGAFNHPGWSAATFAPASRTLQNVRSVSAIVQRFEANDGVSVDAFVASWSAFEGIVYTGHEHAPLRPSFIAVIRHARCVSAREHEYVVHALGREARAVGAPFDPDSCNPARFIFLPGSLPGQEFRAVRLAGE